MERMSSIRMVGRSRGSRIYQICFSLPAPSTWAASKSSGLIAEIAARYIMELYPISFQVLESATISQKCLPSWRKKIPSSIKPQAIKS